MTAKMMRITGPVEIRDDAVLKARLINDMPFLATVGTGAKDPIFQVFRLAKGEAVFWMMKDILREHSIERLQF